MFDLYPLALTLSQLAEVRTSEYKLEQYYRVLDFTRLVEDDEASEIEQFVKTAIKADYPVAAICLYPQYLAQAKRLINPAKPLAIATVVNFPDGNTSFEQLEKEIRFAIEQGADEIDFVYPYQPYLKDNSDMEGLTLLEKVRACCADKKLKVILETGAFDTPEKIYSLSKSIVDLDVDYIKTSTGKFSIGASFEAVYAIAQAIKDSKQSNRRCGVKVSGGVKTVEQAAQYIKLIELVLNLPSIGPDAIRIGASSLLQELENIPR